MRFQNHVKNQFLFHKQTIKLCKKKKYKNPIGGGQTVRKFIIAKEYEKDFFVKQLKLLQQRKQAEQEMTKKPEVNIGDIISGKNAAVAAAQATSETGRESEELKELHLPGGQTTKQAAASVSAAPDASATAASKKPLVMEMKERPGLEADYETDPTVIKLVFTVEKENSSKNIDLDVAEKELRIESAK